MASMQRESGCALTIRLLGRTEIRRLAKELEFRPRKSLGQNFVHDANTVRRVVATSGVNRSDVVLEVGPGLGSLTLALLDRGAAVSAIEIDPVLAGRLPQTVAEHSNSDDRKRGGAGRSGSSLIEPSDDRKRGGAGRSGSSLIQPSDDRKRGGAGRSGSSLIEPSDDRKRGGAGRSGSSLIQPSEIHRLTVCNRDVLSLRRGDLATDPTALVANLPYNVAVPALLHLLAEFPSIRTVTVMVQAEVAERLAAEPGGKDYGVPSVKLRFFGRVQRCGMVSPTVFWPIPRVFSGLVRVDRYETSPWPTDEAFRRQVFELVDIAFAQRRKTARNAFVEWAGSGNESANRLLAASIDPARRGETLSIDDFVRLLQRSDDRDDSSQDAAVRPASGQASAS